MSDEVNITVVANPEILAPAVPDELVDQVVAEINETARASALELALSIGRIIATGIYGGDLTAWRDDTPYGKG